MTCVWPSVTTDKSASLSLPLEQGEQINLVADLVEVYVQCRGTAQSAGIGEIVSDIKIEAQHCRKGLLCWVFFSVKCVQSALG